MVDERYTTETVSLTDWTQTMATKPTIRIVDQLWACDTDLNWNVLYSPGTRTWKRFEPIEMVIFFYYAYKVNF